MINIASIYSYNLSILIGVCSNDFPILIGVCTDDPLLSREVGMDVYQIESFILMTTCYVVHFTIPEDEKSQIAQIANLKV